MGKDLRILISATLNEGKSIGDINDAIKRIQKHASLQKIKLDIEIGKNLSQTLSSFIASIDKITKATQLQSNALSGSTNNIKNETDAMNRATQAAKQFRLEREKVVKAFGEEQYRVQTYGNNLNNNKQIVTKHPNGEVKGNIIETYDYAKDARDAAQAIEKRRQLERNLIRDVDKAHYEAFIEKEKREKHLGETRVLDQVRAYEVAKREDSIFNQKRLNEQQKFVQLQEKAWAENKKRDEDFLLSKARMEAKIADVTRRFGSSTKVKSQIDELNASFGQITKASNYKKALADIDIGLKNIVASAKTSGSHIESLSESFKTAISRTITWTLTMGSLYGSLHALQAAVDTIIEIDSQMTQLKRVMSGSTDFEGMLQNSIDLSNELGRTLNQTLDVMIDFARQGFNEVDTTNLSKTAILMQNISEMTPKESVDALTSAMIAFNIESSKSIKIADSINEIDNNFAVTSQNLAVALQRAGSSARTFGATMEETLGHATAIMAVTRESGSIIGNSLKSIYSRITTMSEAETILNGIGISIRTMSGDVRRVDSILGDLAEQWNTLTNEQQQNIGVTLAGRYQLNRFLALMSNYEMGIDATNTALHSQGSASRENEKYMESLQARIEKMKVAWQSLAVSMGDAVISNSLVNLIALATNFGNVFKWLTDTVGVLPVVLGVLSMAIYGLSAAFRTVMINITQTIAGILGIPVAASAAAGGTNILARALQFLAGSASVAKGAIRGLLSATVVGGVFVALGAGLEWLINKFTDTKIAAEDTATSLNDTVAKVSDIKYLKELGDQYDKLAKQTNLSADEKTKLFKIESELESRFGISAKGLDNQTSAYEQNTKAIQQKVAALQEEVKIEREKAALAFYSEETSIRDSIGKKKQEAEEANRLLDEARNKYDSFLKSKESGSPIDNDGLYSITGFMNATIDPKNSNFADGVQRLGEFYASNVKELQEKFDKANNELQQNLNKAAQGINGKFQGYLNILEANGEKISPLMSSIFEGLASADASSNLNLTTQQLDQFFNAFNNKNISSIQDLDNVFRTLPPDLQLTGEQLDGVRLALLRIKFPAQLEEDMLNAADSAEVLGVNTGDLADETKKTVDGIKELNNVLHQLKEGQSLSSDAMFDLITKYPELRDNVYKTADGWKVEEDAVNALREAKLKKVQEDIKNENASTATSLNNALQRIRGYGVEIKQIKNLQDAKNALNSLESELDSSRNPLGKKAGMFDPLFGAPDSVKAAANNYIDDKQAALTGAIIDTKNYISSAEQGEAEIMKLMDMVSDPNFGVSPSKEKKEKKGKKDKDDAAEKARKAREDAYNKDVARFKYLVEMQNWTTDDQIKGWDRIAQRHKQHLKENVDNERSINLEVKKLREQRFKDEMDALDKRVEKMRLSNATEVKMDQERLKTYKALATRKDLTPEQQADLKTKIFDTSKRIDDGRLAETNEYLTKRNKVVSEYNRLLSYSEKQQNLYNEGTAEYNQELVTQNQLRKKMITFYNDEIYWITERLKKGDLTKAQTDALITQMDEYKSALLDVSVAQRNMASKIADDTINKVIEAYKKAEKAALEAIDAQIKSEDERHDKVMKDYDDELNAFNAIVDAKLKEISRQKNEESYEKQLANKQKEQAKIQQDINKLLLDDSDSGRYKRQQLEEDLAKVIDEIQTMQNDRTYELRERELNDLKDQKKEQIDVNKKTEDNLHKVLKDSLDKKKKDEETYWKSILENDQYFTQLREDIINGSLDSITSSFDLFKTDVLSHLQDVEDGIQNSIIDKMNEAQRSLSALGYSSVASSGTNDSTGKTVSRPSPFDRMSDSDFNMYKTNKRIWEQSRDEQVKSQAAIQNAKLREKYGIAKDNFTYGQIAKFDTGGMTPAWGNKDGKFLLAHEKELILNKDDTSNMLKLVDITRNIISNLNPLKSLQLATPAGTPAAESSIYQVNLYVDNMTGSKEDTNNVLSTVVKGLKKLGR